MFSLWRELFKTLGRRAGGDAGNRAQPPALEPARVAKRPAGVVAPGPGVLDRRPVVKCNTPHGIFCLPEDFAGDALARAIADGTPVEPEVLDLLRQHIVAGGVVIDVGAGFGRMSALFSGLTGPAGQVMAFEADEYLCDVLQHTIRFNQCENVRVFFGAVYDGSRSRVTFPAAPVAVDAAYSGQYIDPAANGAATLHTLTIDALQIQAPVSLIYIDTNGCELQVLRGAADTIARLRMPVVLRFDPVLAIRFGATADNLTEFFDAIGYAMVARHAGHLCVAVPRDRPATGEKQRDDSRPVAVARHEVVTPPPALMTLCKLLKNRAEVDACTLYLKKSGYVPHHVSCKDWDLAHVIPSIGDGNFLDMGSSDSYILKNLALKPIRGELYGIDLRAPDMPVGGVHYLIGDLMTTPLPAGYFTNITCLSVLEHQVDYEKFAAETSRLLGPGGRVFVTFDYWEPRVTPPIKLYGLDWALLDADMVRRFIASCARHGLDMVEEFDFSAGDPLICGDYYSPHPEVSYTFGMVVFRKR